MKNEPVAWINKTTLQYLTELGYCAKVYPKRSDGDIPLYTHPVKELTDEDVERIAGENAVCFGGQPLFLLRFARALLKEAQEK